MAPVAPKKKFPFGLVAGGIVVLGVVGGFIALAITSSDIYAPRKKPVAPTVVNVTLPPPPPPPPPPPQREEPPPPEEQKMVEQEPIAEEEPPPEAPAPEQPPADLTTNLSGGNGNDFGLRQGNGRGGNGTIGGTGNSRGGSKWGWYASGVQRSISDALRRHPSTRFSNLSVQVRIWPDSTGRITRAQLVGSSGNASLDDALKNQILTGLQLAQAPPADMPLPIVMRITARKP
jgi:protein TonB